MLIGQVAAQAAVNTQTLRYYERRGLLPRPERSRAGYRQYTQDTVRVVRFIKRAQDLGFTLKEVRELLRFRTGGPQNRSEMRDIAAAKIEDIDERMRDLRRIRKALTTLHDSCTCASRVLDCPILEALEVGTVVAGPTNGSTPRRKSRRTP